jgi:hypothetical protein
MNGSTKEPDSPAQPTTLLASFCSVLLLLRRRLALPSSSSPSTSLVTILDRSLGAAVTLGLSLAILKWVATKHTNSDGSNAKPTRRSLTSDTKNDYSSETKFNYSSSGLPSWLEELIRWILPFGYYSTSNCNEDDDETSTNEEIIIHTGSCHCQSIVFQVRGLSCEIAFCGRQSTALNSELRLLQTCLTPYPIIFMTSLVL